MRCLRLRRSEKVESRLPHEAGADFFATKREWSKRKDSIIEFYLKPYLAKVALLRRLILLVDAFAGAAIGENAGKS